MKKCKNIKFPLFYVFRNNLKFKLTKLENSKLIILKLKIQEKYGSYLRRLRWTRTWRVNDRPQLGSSYGPTLCSAPRRQPAPQPRTNRTRRSTFWKKITNTSRTRCNTPL